MVPVLRVAGQQIDARPGGRLAWLLEFVREDPARWQPADREAHGNRLLAFIYTPMPPNLLRRVELIEPLAPGDAVETLQAELRDWLRQLVSAPFGTRVPVPREDLEEVMIRMTAPGEKPSIFALSWGGPRRTMLFQAVKLLILRSEDPLIACHTCGEPILALRKRLFCDNRCLQKWHDREKAKQRRKGSPR
jgi:hypothetical protein